MTGIEYVGFFPESNTYYSRFNNNWTYTPNIEKAHRFRRPCEVIEVAQRNCEEDEVEVHKTYFGRDEGISKVGKSYLIIFKDGSESIFVQTAKELNEIIYGKFSENSIENHRVMDSLKYGYEIEVNGKVAIIDDAV